MAASAILAAILARWMPTPSVSAWSGPTEAKSRLRREAAEEAGYLAQGSDTSDLLEAICGELSGQSLSGRAGRGTVSGAAGEPPRLGRSRVNVLRCTGGGVSQRSSSRMPAAFALSLTPGNRQRKSIAADSATSSPKMARIAASSASVTNEHPRTMAMPARLASGARHLF